MTPQGARSQTGTGQMDLKALLAKAAGLVALCALGGAPAAARGGLSAEIVRTDYGVPHITAKDFAGLGFGED